MLIANFFFAENPHVIVGYIRLYVQIYTVNISMYTHKRVTISSLTSQPNQVIEIGILMTEDDSDSGHFSVTTIIVTD